MEVLTLSRGLVNGGIKICQLKPIIKPTTGVKHFPCFFLFTYSHFVENLDILSISVKPFSFSEALNQVLCYANLTYDVPRLQFTGSLVLMLLDLHPLIMALILHSQTNSENFVEMRVILSVGIVF